MCDANKLTGCDACTFRRICASDKRAEYYTQVFRRFLRGAPITPRFITTVDPKSGVKTTCVTAFNSEGLFNAATEEV